MSSPGKEASQSICSGGRDVSPQPGTSRANVTPGPAEATPTSQYRQILSSCVEDLVVDMTPSSPKRPSAVSGKAPLKRKPVDLNGLLAMENPYKWGIVCSNAYAERFEDFLLICPQRAHADAKIYIAKGDEEIDPYLSMTCHIQAASIYAVIAQFALKYRKEPHAAAPMYELGISLLDSIIDKLEFEDKLTCKQQRFHILCLKFKSWLLYRSYAMFDASDRLRLERDCQEFLAIGESLRFTRDSDLPGPIEFPTGEFMDVYRFREGQHFLLESLRSWDKAEWILDRNKYHQLFFLASESAVEKYVDFMSLTRHMLVFVRETLCRLYMFDEPGS
ncbi:uncharacterized protein LOC100902396 [Galendromus occidentalis]|uniref:Uncharacterized protein LOC100902396 n=1 Tax=Galendromus occidentalis TaxID=34638 RepID=A0AAJ6QQ39_9ACAR|nr:uncharacterized protein LOC100902396 [Galendromus occidentalis]